VRVLSARYMNGRVVGGRKKMQRARGGLGTRKFKYGSGGKKKKNLRSGGRKKQQKWGCAESSKTLEIMEVRTIGGEKEINSGKSLVI